MRRPLSIATVAVLPLLVQAEVGGNVAVTSDYVWRGISQTLEDPAIQGGFDWMHESGFDMGIWASNVDFYENNDPGDDEADLELDVYANYAVSLNKDWGISGGIIRYMYPGTVSGTDLDFNEISLGLSYKDYGFSINHSNDVFSSGDSATHYAFNGSWSLPQDLVLGAFWGFYNLEDYLDDNNPATNDEESYWYYSLALSREIKNVNLTLSLIDTSSDGDKIWGNKIAGNRVVFTISTSF